MQNAEIEHGMNDRCGVVSGTPRRRTNRDLTRIDMSPILPFILNSVQGSHGKLSLAVHFSIRGTQQLLHRSLANDFALLFTESEFELAEHIDTVCLPQVLVDLVMILKMNMVNFNHMVDNIFCPWS